MTGEIVFMYEYIEKKSVLLQSALSQDLPDVVPD